MKSAMVIRMVNSIEFAARGIVPNWGDFERADVDQLREWLDEAEEIAYMAEKLQKVFKKQIAIKKDKVDG